MPHFQQNPTFIGIGPTKTGSTWMFMLLMSHPEISMPLIKEVNYFFVEKELGRKALWYQKLGRNKVANAWYRPQLRHFLNIQKDHLFSRKKIKLEELSWGLRFFLGTNTDSWYLSLFEKGKVAGDISPMYSELGDEEIRRIRELLPEAKIIIGLRDPVERTWSNAKMTHVKIPGFAKPEEVEDKVFLNSFAYSLDKGLNDSVALVEKWKRHFSDEQIGVYFYDEIIEQPKALYDRMCQFLNLSTHTNSQLDQFFNQGISGEIPPHLKAVLIRQNFPLIEKMVTYFDSPYPKNWLEKYASEKA